VFIAVRYTTAERDKISWKKLRSLRRIPKVRREWSDLDQTRPLAQIPRGKTKARKLLSLTHLEMPMLK